MQYKTSVDEANGCLVLKLSGVVTSTELAACFKETEEILRYDFHLRLIINGANILRFDISNTECQLMAPDLFSFVRRAAFFSPNSLVYGMMRVMQACSFNENFGVFRAIEQAVEFVSLDRTAPRISEDR